MILIQQTLPRKRVWHEFSLSLQRNTTDEFDGFLKGYRYLIMNRDGKFTEAFRDALGREGVEPVRCPPRAPFCEYSRHYLRERNHQCVGNQLLEPSNIVAFSTEPVRRRERLGGMLNFYHREAA